MKRNIEKAVDLGNTWADDMFDFFSNAKHRGPNFTWERFPRIVADIAEANCPVSFSHRTRNMKVLNEACYNAAFEKAKELVKIKLNEK